MPVENLLPNGNSVTSGWTAEGGPDYTSVDDPVGSPDDGTTKVYTPTANHLFSVTLQNTALTTETINKVTGTIRMYALDPISATVQMYVTVGGTDYFSDTKDTVNNNTTYVNFTYDWTTSPATGIAWTVSELNALVFGIKKINTAGMRCTQMYVSVDYTAAGGAVVKTYNGLAIASVKTVGGLAIASVKTINGISNV